MTAIDLVGDALIVSGVGTSLLRLKATVSKIVPWDEVRNLSRESFSFPLRYGYRLIGDLEAMSVSVSGVASEAMAKRSATIENHFRAKETVNAIVESGTSETGSDWDSILDPHQGIAVNSMTADGLLGMCLFDEQGTGKTLTSIAAFDVLREKQEVERALVIAPKSLVEEWVKEIKKFLPGKYELVVIDGTQEAKYRALQSPADIYITNYESVVGLTSSFKANVRNRQTLLIVDESHYIKNPAAVRSKKLAEVRANCNRAFVLCGTPAPNRPRDIINQFDLADSGVAFEGFRYPDNPQEAVTRVQDRIQERGIYLRRTKTEVLPDLPEKCFNVVRVTMGQRQRALYEKAERELVLYLRSLDNRSFARKLTTYFQRRAALLQICVSPKLIDPLYREIPAKYLELDHLVRNLVRENDRKVIVWSVYTKTLDQIEERYFDLGLVRVDGTIASGQRAEAVRRFQEDEKTKVFIGNPAAAGAGLNLHAASHSIYVSFSNQAAHYLQSLDRTHRRGQLSKKVDYYLLVCQDTLEERELQRLREKENCQKELLWDPMDGSVTLEGALEELIGRT